MVARKPITNFSRGEFAPELYGRVDIPQYEAGAKQIKNFIVQRYGGVRFRDGFRFVAPIFGNIDTPAKLVPFQFSMEQAYVHVLGDEIMRVAAQGGMVTEADLKIVSVTYGNPTVLEIPYHDMQTGDQLYLTGNTGPAGLNDRFVRVTGIPDASHVQIDLNSTGFAALTASTGATRVAPPAPPVTPEVPPPAPPPPPEAPDVGRPGDDDAPVLQGYGGGYWHNVDLV